MKYVKAILVSTLLIAGGAADAKGFIFAKTLPPYRNFETQVSISRCAQWKNSTRTSDSCNAYDTATNITSDRFEPVAAGFYKVNSVPIGDENIFEVKEGQATNLELKTFDPSVMVKLVPTLEYYIKQSRYYFSIQRDFRNKDYQLSTEKMTRDLIKTNLDTHLQDRTDLCNDRRAVRQIIADGKVRICYSGKTRMVPVKIFPEAQRILRLMETDISNGFYINKYGQDGLHTLTNLNGLRLLDANDRPVEAGETAVAIGLYTYNWNLGNQRFSSIEEKQKSYSADKHFVLFPGDYIIVVSDSSEVVDILNLRIQ